MLWSILAHNKVSERVKILNAVARLSLRNMVSKEANPHVIRSILYLFNLVELRMRGLSPIDLDELFAQVDTVMVEHRVRQHVA